MGFSITQARDCVFGWIRRLRRGAVRNGLILRNNAWAPIDRFSVKEGIGDHAEKCAETSHDAPTHKRRAAAAESGDGLAGGAQDSAGGSADTEADERAAVHTIHTFDVAAGEYHAARSVLGCACEAGIAGTIKEAVAEGVSALELDFDLRAAGKRLDGTPVVKLGKRVGSQQESKHSDQVIQVFHSAILATASGAENVGYDSFLTVT